MYTFNFCLSNARCNSEAASSPFYALFIFGLASLSIAPSSADFGCIVAAAAALAVEAGEPASHAIYFIASPMTKLRLGCTAGRQG